jgi:hypothetical protein
MLHSLHTYIRHILAHKTASCLFDIFAQKILQCDEFHSGEPFFNPGSSGQYRYCEDSRWSMAGALITFIAMHLNIYACTVVVVKNHVCVCFLFF